MLTLAMDMPLPFSTIFSTEGLMTTALVPTVTRLDTTLDVNPVSIVLVVSIVCILSPITITGNSIILASFYRYKRLRTASNCLLVSLAISDFGVGVFMPFGMQLELSGLPENGVSALCVVPYCIVIALCSASVLVTVAIAVDRLTSLAQPLRYKNIITHSSIGKYIAVFWIYAIAVGFSPLAYAQITERMQSYNGSCRFDAAILPPVRVFLVVAVWAPSALVLLGCYIYVYLVARAHARAIYTVELSFRHQTQTLALPRYGQTLAVTVGAFLILWLPFQTCMLVDIFRGTNILSEWTVMWLGLPILAHSGMNPWIYAFHHGEMRIAVGKIAEDLIALFGVAPSRHGCSPMRRETNTNLELADMNNEMSNESRRHPLSVAIKQHNVLYTSRRCLETSDRHTDISPEKYDIDYVASCSSQPDDIIEEDIHDLTKMLDPKYMTYRNHVIDSNHNIDRIKNLKYLLDPTFNKIRHLRRLNHKRMSGKNLMFISESKFISYQNLKSDGEHSGRKFLQVNALSDSMLNADTPAVDANNLNQVLCHDSVTCKRRNSNLSSISDSNLKTVTVYTHGETRSFSASGDSNTAQNLDHGYEGALTKQRMMLRRQTEGQQNGCNNKVSSHPRLKFRGRLGRVSPNLKLSSNDPSASSSISNSVETTSCEASTSRRNIPRVTITSNKLVDLINLDPSPRDAHMHTHIGNHTARTLTHTRKNFDMLKHSESINTIDPAIHRVTLLEPSNLMDSLLVPTIHSEPPSPMDPHPSLPSLQAEEARSLEIPRSIVDTFAQRPKSSLDKKCSPIRHSDPIVPTVLLNIEDLSEPYERSDNQSDNRGSDLLSNNTPTLEPIELFEALLKNSDKFRDTRLPEPIFAEHDSTRFSSRRPSDSKWSESSRSQEILPNVTEYQKSFPSFYSVNDFQTCTSGSDLNDLTSLDPFMCPDALTSSLHESFFSAPSVPDSDIFTSFEESDEPIFMPDFTSDSERNVSMYNSTSGVNSKRRVVETAILQSKSTESVHRARYPSTRSCAILRLEPTVHSSNRLHVRRYANYILKDPPSVKGNLRLAPLAIPTPTDICTPTFDIVSEIKNDNECKSFV